MFETTKLSNKLKPLRDILKPSGTGLLFYTAFSLIIIVGQNLNSFKQHLEVPDGTNLNFFGYLYNHLVSGLGTGRSNALAEIIFWSAVGLVIYVFVVGCQHVFEVFARDVKEVKYVHPPRTDSAATIKSFLKRAGFHIICLLGLVYYLIFLAQAVFGGRLQRWIARTHWLGLHSSVTLLILFLIECVALHVAAVILRLLFLRRRLFG